MVISSSADSSPFFWNAPAWFHPWQLAVCSLHPMSLLKDQLHSLALHLDLPYLYIAQDDLQNKKTGCTHYCVKWITWVILEVGYIRKQLQPSFCTADIRATIHYGQGTLKLIRRPYHGQSESSFVLSQACKCSVKIYTTMLSNQMPFITILFMWALLYNE